MRGGCRIARCGDGFTRAGVEACDDGNELLSDACPSGTAGTCQDAFCGDGFTSDPIDALARAIARLRPAEVAALVTERMQAARASVIIVAAKERGLPLFRSIGVEDPRIVE